MFRLINVGLRGLTLLSKFLLIFFLAKFLPADAVGVYGLLSAGIGYGIYVLGGEFYNFANRELIGSERSAWLRLIRDQAVLYSLLYVLFLPLLFGVFWQGWLPWSFFSWFFILLFLEHIAQEANRILIATSQQLLASLVLFLRSGLWCLAVVGIMWWSREARVLEVTLAAWVLGCLIACGVALNSFFRLDRSEIWLPIDWVWIRRGVLAALPLLVASLAVRGIYTFDRYWVEYVASLHVLGAYVLYVGMATAILSFLDAGVVVFFFPRLVKAAKQKQAAIFETVMRELAVNVTLVVLVLSLCCWLSSFWIVGWLNQPVYKENIVLLYWLLIATSLYGLSMIPHLGLYARGEDKQILYAQLCGFSVFIGMAFFFAEYGAVSVTWAMSGAFGVVLIWKALAYRMLQKITT